MNYLGIDLDIKNIPQLDEAFIPMGPWMIAYEKEADRPVAIAIEREEGKVSVRSRFEGDEGMKPLQSFISDICEEIRTKAIRKEMVQEEAKQ